MNVFEIEEAISAVAEQLFVGDESRLRWRNTYNLRVAGKNAK